MIDRGVPGRCDAARVVAAARARLRARLAAQHQLLVSVAVASPLPVAASKPCIQHLTFYLIDRAALSLAEPGIVLLQVAPCEARPGFALFTVRDTGLPVNDRRLSLSALRRAARLQVAIERLVSALGGAIADERVAPRGTRVDVWLPLERPALKPARTCPT